MKDPNPMPPHSIRGVVGFDIKTDSQNQGTLYVAIEKGDAPPVRFHIWLYTFKGTTNQYLLGSDDDSWVTDDGQGSVSGAIAIADVNQKWGGLASLRCLTTTTLLPS